MNTFIKVASVLASSSLIGLIIAPKVQAQATPSTIDISDQARFVENLETKNQTDWTFGAESRNETLVDQTVEFNEIEAREDEDVELVEIEEEFQEWDNKGDDEDSAVMVEVYDF